MNRMTGLSKGQILLREVCGPETVRHWEGPLDPAQAYDPERLKAARRSKVEILTWTKARNRALPSLPTSLRHRPPLELL